MCLSATRLSPGKSHKVPVPLSAWSQSQVAFTTLGRVLVLFLTTQSPLSPWIKSAALQGRCLHVNCALLCRKLPKEINVNSRDVPWQAASWSSVPSTLTVPAGALPGDNCPSPTLPLPGDTADAWWVTGELWLLLQRPWRCLLDVEAIPGADPWPREVWYRAAAPARTPRCRELSCCLSLRKEPPGKPLGSQIFRHLVLFLVQFPVLGWNSLEATPVSSSLSVSHPVSHAVPCLSSPGFTLRLVLSEELGSIVISL